MFRLHRATLLFFRINEELTVTTIAMMQMRVQPNELNRNLWHMRELLSLVGIPMSPCSQNAATSDGQLTRPPSRRNLSQRGVHIRE